MRKLKLKKSTRENEGGLSYVTLICQILQNPIVENGQPKPLTTAEIMEFIPIVRQVKAVDLPETGEYVTIELEDAEYKAIADRVEKWPWGGATETIFDFIEDVRNAEKVKKAPPKKEG